MLNDHTPYTRRMFLERGALLASALATTPWFVERSARAMLAPPGLSSTPGAPEERVLVVLQLAGGNDGLNTVVPASMGEYYDARPGIAVPAREALALGSAGVALHPGLAPLKDLYDDGVVSIVQGVGYPNPNRSHFASMDIWHTATESARGPGWLGRYFDNECAGAPRPELGVALGDETPLAMQGRTVRPVTFDDAGSFEWRAGRRSKILADSYARVMDSGEAPGVGRDSSAAYLMRTALDARLVGARITAATNSDPLSPYPKSPLANQLKTVAAMIRAGLPTRVYYVSLGGFDTHAGQGGVNGRHAQRLGELAGALAAFVRDLRASGDSGRVLTMVFSEFGRRVSQNASGGTDHGAAAPMFLVGEMVRPGLAGAHPSLSDLDEGDLKYSIDFRRVYAGVLRDWMGTDAAAILGAGHRPVALLKRSR